MKIGDIIYFAPGIQFSALDLDGIKLPKQYRARIEGYYLSPADRAVKNGDAFAAGLLAIAAVDAMSRHYFGPNRPTRKVKSDFRSFALVRLRSFSKPENAEILYEKYRNGLVHEARLKDGCQFEIGRSETLDMTGPVPLIDPLRLVGEVRESLEVLVSELEKSTQFRYELAKRLKEEFGFELGGSKRGRLRRVGNHR